MLKPSSNSKSHKCGYQASGEPENGQHLELKEKQKVESELRHEKRPDPLKCIIGSSSLYLVLKYTTGRGRVEMNNKYINLLTDG